MDGGSARSTTVPLKCSEWQRVLSTTIAALLETSYAA